MAAKDFSRPQGPRLRITLSRYEPRTRTFKAVKNSAALVTVANAAEQKRLWSKIEDAIAGEDWRDGADSSVDPVASAGAAV